MLVLDTDAFSDRRLLTRLNHIYTQMVVHQRSIINQCCQNQKDKIGAYRFLNNTEATSSAITSALLNRCRSNSHSYDHVLCIQDTSEINYEGHRERMQKKRNKLGEVNQHQCGTFLHPVLVVEASCKVPLGFSHVKLWNRDPDASDRKTRNYRYQPIEEKESYRWIEAALESNSNMDPHLIKTIIGDREADIFELFSRVPPAGVHLLIRSTHPRLCKLNKDDPYRRLDEQMACSPIRGEYSFEVRSQKDRKKRTAHMEVRFEDITLHAPLNGASASKETVKLYCIHVKEKMESVPATEEPIEWRLLTTHTVTTLNQALECVEWYRCRWFIEELFRVLKSKGFMIEQAQLESIEALHKLILISLQAALQVMVLKLSFDTENEELPADYYFEDKEMELLHITGKKCEGKTKIQQNPYRKESMAWAAWIIARLGSWSAYKSQSIPGYITLKNGLEYFYKQFELYEFITNQNVYKG